MISRIGIIPLKVIFRNSPEAEQGFDDGFPSVDDSIPPAQQQPDLPKATHIPEGTLPFD
jgi:hypothetical protein